jgi:hypothetical protein
MNVAFTCPRCGRSSQHPDDAKEGYCGACHDYTGPGNPMDTPPRERYGHDMYWDRNGVPLSLREWAELRENTDHSYVALGRDTIGFYLVSTVWIGLDLGYNEPQPLIFETMVFVNGSCYDMYCHRYATEAEALAGHEAVCAEIRVGEQDSAQHGEQPAQHDPFKR